MDPAQQRELRSLQVGRLRMKLATQGMKGSGPLVLLCHGFPELWLSWRAQMDALAAAGYRVVAPDMRGYGGTDAPADIDQYTMLHLVGDMVDLLAALGEKQAVIVGHDWGAPVAWHAALLRPDLFPAVVGMSVPFAMQGRTDLLSALVQMGIDDFYLQYFQTPGVAEAELERDAATSIRRIHTSGVARTAGAPRPAEAKPAAERAVFGRLRGAGFLSGMAEPDELPAWLTHDDVAAYAAEFGRTGFRGGLNWYRNLRRNWELMAPWRGAVIHQPSMFIAGARDGVLQFPSSMAQIGQFGRSLPGLRGCHILEGAGHWIQRERADEVNALLLGFLESL